MSFCVTLDGFPASVSPPSLLRAASPRATSPPAHRQRFSNPNMRLNAFLPTRDIGSDPAKIRDWARAAEDLGYAHIEVADHVFGATARDGWTPLYNETD